MTTKKCARDLKSGDILFKGGFHLGMVLEDAVTEVDEPVLLYWNTGFTLLLDGKEWKYRYHASYQFDVKPWTPSPV